MLMRMDETSALPENAEFIMSYSIVNNDIIKKFVCQKTICENQCYPWFHFISVNGYFNENLFIVSRYLISLIIRLNYQLGHNFSE